MSVTSSQLSAVLHTLLELPLRRALVEHLLREAVIAAAVAAVSSGAAENDKMNILADVELIKESVGHALGSDKKASVHDVKRHLIARGQRGLAKEVAEFNVGKRAFAHPSRSLPARVSAAMGLAMETAGKAHAEDPLVAEDPWCDALSRRREERLKDKATSQPLQGSADALWARWRPSWSPAPASEQVDPPHPRAHDGDADAHGDEKEAETTAAAPAAVPTAEEGVYSEKSEGEGEDVRDLMAKLAEVHDMMAKFSEMQQDMIKRCKGEEEEEEQGIDVKPNERHDETAQEESTYFPP